MLTESHILTIGYEIVTTCQFLKIVVGMIVKRSISFVYLLSFINQMQFLSSDLISSKFHNQWEYDSLLKLSVGIRPRHSSWSVVLVPSLLAASLTLGRSAIQYSMMLLAFTSDFHVWSRRVHYVLFLPTLTITIFYRSVPTCPTSIISSRSMTSINAISFLRTPLQVLIQSVHWRITSFISVVIL